MQYPKDLMVYLDNMHQNSFAALISYAAALAQKWGAHLTVAFASQDLALNLHAGFTRGAATTHMLDAYPRRKQASEEVARAILQEVGTRHGVHCEFRVCENERGEALMLHARHSALAIFGSDRRPDCPISALPCSKM